jgi:hypothetical protein
VYRPLLNAGSITTDTGLAWRRDTASLALLNFVAIAQETFARRGAAVVESSSGTG